MAALDTNVLVRFLVGDDTAQFALAQQLIRRCVQAGQALYVPVTVTLELEWVLRSRFGFRADEITEVLSRLLSSVELSFEQEGAVEIALQHRANSNADFSDCLHAALASAAGEEPMWTFDKAAAKVAGARLLIA